NAAQRTLDVEVRRYEASVEAEYFGEPRPSGWLGRLLAPGGGEVRHIDRFFSPSIAQVEYAMGDRTHVLVTAAVTPRDEGRVTVYASAVFKLRIPRVMVRWIGIPMAKKILKQDAEILRAQRKNIVRFGHERYTFVASDILGSAIFRLLHKKENPESVVK